jgi:phosphoglycolate phosphatase
MIRSSSTPIVVFDLDGTLADTAPDLLATLDVILDAEGVPRLPAAQARELIGAGARALIERGLQAAGHDVPAARLEALYRKFLVHYGETLCVETTLFPGVEAALDRFEAAGFRLAVCTNKTEALSVRLLRALGIGERFAAVCGRDSFPYCKPDPRHLTLTIEKAGGDPAQAVMIGDSRTDVATAKAAGIPVVAVSFGYTEIPVGDLGADRVVDHFDELFAAVRDCIAVSEPA